MKKNVILSIVLVSCCLLLSFIINPYLAKVHTGAPIEYGASIIVYLCIIIVNILFFKPTKELLYITDEKTKQYKKKRILIVASILIILLILKSLVAYRVNHIIKQNNYLNITVAEIICLILGGFAEEILFRFILYYKTLRNYLPKTIAVFATAFIFALCHGLLNYYFIAMIIMGLIYTVAFEFCPSVFIIGLWHILWNLSNYI